MAKQNEDEIKREAQRIREKKRTISFFNDLKRTRALESSDLSLVRKQGLRIKYKNRELVIHLAGEYGLPLAVGIYGARDGTEDLARAVSVLRGGVRPLCAYDFVVGGMAVSTYSWTANPQNPDETKRDLESTRRIPYFKNFVEYPLGR